MSKQCEICGKKPQFGHNVSHSNNKTNRRWNPNLQHVSAVVVGTPTRLKVCTSCLQAGKVVKKSPRTWVAAAKVAVPAVKAVKA